MVKNMWMLDEVIVARNVNLLFFIVEFLIGVSAFSLAIFLKRKDALMLFVIGAFGNMAIEIIGLITATRIYLAPETWKPFIIASIGMGEGGAAMCFTWLIATYVWSYLHAREKMKLRQ
jgi:hypothetical protein